MMACSYGIGDQVTLLPDSVREDVLKMGTH
jgi:hypothetical protein